MHAFRVKSFAHLFQANPTEEEIEIEVEAYMMSIHQTNKKIFK